MRVAFLNPPFLPKYSRSQRSPGVIKSGTLYYPYWLAHAAALCLEKGHEVLLVDAPADGLEKGDVVKKLSAFDPGLVVLDSSTPSIDADLACAASVKKELPDAIVAMAGTHVSALPEDALKQDSVDAVMLGEYDRTAAETADAIGDGNSLESVAGLALPGGKRTAVREMIVDLDSLPWIAPVYNKFLDVDKYYFSLSAHPMAMLISGRGCPNQCFFCLYPQVMHGRKYRTRSPEHIVGEIEYIKREIPRVREIVFEDDTFTADQERTVEFSELMIRKDIRMPWFANVRVDTKKETLAAMKRAGFRACAVGFEAGSDESLKAMGKGSDVDKARRFMAAAKELGIIVHGCFMVGFPGETEGSMKRTLDYAIELEPDSAQFYPVFPYPGTEAYSWAREKGYLRTTNFRHWLTESGGHAAVVDMPGLDADRIWDFCEKAYKRFHFRPKYLLRKLWQALLHPVEGLRSIRSFLYYLAYLFKGRNG